MFFFFFSKGKKKGDTESLRRRKGAVSKFTKLPNSETLKLPTCKTTRKSSRVASYLLHDLREQTTKTNQIAPSPAHYVPHDPLPSLLIFWSF